MLELEVFLKQGTIRASNYFVFNFGKQSYQRLSAPPWDLPTPPGLERWNGFFGMSAWHQSPSLPTFQPKVQLHGCAKIPLPQPWSSTAPAWMWHWKGTPEPHNATAMSSGSNSGCKKASSPFLQLVWLVRHKPGKIPFTINHPHMERMVAAETQNCHSLPGNFPSRDDITRN